MHTYDQYYYDLPHDATPHAVMHHRVARTPAHRPVSPQHRVARRRAVPRHSTPRVVAPAHRRKAATARFLDGELKRPFAQGNLRYVARGVYTSGARSGSYCVIKWPKSHSLANLFRHDLDAVRVARSIVRGWNAARLIDQDIRVNVPVVWKRGDTIGHLADVKVLVEPYIENFRKWNSNSGWCDSSTPWGRVMQALSHYSYHASDGTMLLCDLQGGSIDHHAVITDPAVCSTTRAYGATDIGVQGIQNFFARHQCNEYCHRSWKTPTHVRKVFSAVRSTITRSE